MRRHNLFPCDPYYFHRGKVLTSRPTVVGRLLLLPWLVYREYQPGVGRSPFTQQSIYSGMCGCQYHACGCDVIGKGMWEVQRDRRMRIWGDTPIKGPHAFTPGPIMRHQGTCLRSPDAFAPHRVLTRLKVLRRNPHSACARQAHR